MRIFILFLLFVSSLKAQLQPGFQDEIISGPWQYPSGIVFDENGQGYLWDNIGRVYVIDSSGQVLSTPLIDIAEEVERFINHGLLGFALDPDFQENGYFYLLYTVDRYHLLYADSPDYNPNQSMPYRGTIGRIARYTADASQNFQSTLPDSRKVLLGETASEGFPLIFDSHALGSLVFGADGSLLATCGDAASSLSVDVGSNNDTYYQDGLETDIIRPEENVGAYRSQMLKSLDGKVIRIDPATGDGLPSNPYYEPDQPRSAQSRVWALGLRNPYRMCKVPNSGGHEENDPGWFLIGDVGLGAWEEINLLKEAGQNFGWPLFEGFERQPEYSPRLTYAFDYPLTGPDCEGYPTFQQMMGLATAGECTSDAPKYVHSTPRMAYRNRWNDISVPTIYLSRDSSLDADGVRPADYALSFEGEDFQGDASIAGIFYEGSRFPEVYHGAYFQADYRDWIRVMTIDEEGNFRSVDSFYEGIQKLVHIAYNPYDEWLYAITIDDRKLHKITYGGPIGPKAIIEADQLWGDSPLVVQFSGESSTSNGSPLSYHWRFGEMATSSEVSPSFTFSNTTGTVEQFEVSLVVQDSTGQVDSSSVWISLNNQPPNVDILRPLDNMHYPIGQTSAILTDARVTDRESSNEELSYNWYTLLHHEDHFHPGASSEDIISQFILSPYGCVEEAYWYELILEVTDPQGLVGRDSVLLLPDCDSDWVAFRTVLAERTSDESLMVYWETAKEVELADFIIEYTDDFQHYRPIGNIQTAKNISAGASYRQNINLAAAENEAIRIRARNNRPAFRLSPLVNIAPKEAFANIYPNPSASNLNIDIEEAASNRLRLRLFDNQGQNIGYYFINAEVGQSIDWQIDLSYLATGLYFYLLEDGPRSQLGKWLKQ